MKKLNRRFSSSLILLLLLSLWSLDALACACGCGIFDVGTRVMLPDGCGDMAYFEYDYLDQTKNWHGTSQAASSDNADQKIESHFLTFGNLYMFDRSWGVQVEVPITFRNFQTIDPTSGALDTFNHAALGDIRIRGLYTGFSPDMSTGISYGLRLPTGDSTFAGFDPDTEIGSGSTDILLGIYHFGAITENPAWAWFMQANLDEPVLTQNGYFPGSELDAAVGAYYNGLKLSQASKLVPILQLLTSLRASDHGSNPATDPMNSGYERLLISPGLEFDTGSFRFYGDVEFPIYQYMNGDQLVPNEAFKAIVSYSF